MTYAVRKTLAFYALQRGSTRSFRWVDRAWRQFGGASVATTGVGIDAACQCSARRFGEPCRVHEHALDFELVRVRELM
jgi:hypothetical protein